MGEMGMVGRFAFIGELASHSWPGTAHAEEAEEF
jgi:hypothetical protein